MQVDERIGTTDCAEDNIDLMKEEVNRVSTELANQQQIYHPNIEELIHTDERLDSYIESNIQNFYFKLIKTPIVNNYSISELISGITYFICRDDNIPRTLDEISYVCLSDYFPIEDRDTF
jgi:transcription initiation factor TFIIIB Brf1 subunit/transcription initiation factor TFIIB